MTSVTYRVNSRSLTQIFPVGTKRLSYSYSLFFSSFDIMIRRIVID